MLTGKQYKFGLLIITAVVSFFVFSGCAPVLRKSAGVRVEGDIVKGDQERNVSITTRNQERLVAIALADPDEDVREAATQLLTNQVVLTQIAFSDASRNVRIAAVERIKNEDVLINVTMTNSEPLVRLAATGKIRTDQAFYDIAMNNSDDMVRCAAV
jgi:hypothetical protein